MTTSQTLIEVRQPEPTKNLVESIPVQEGIKLSKFQRTALDDPCSWQDMRGLAWLFFEDRG